MSDSDPKDNAFSRTDVMPADVTPAVASGPQLALQMGGSAGTMLRRAREAAGIAPTEMATVLKVDVKKLNALEEDRYTDLPDLAFARALAKSICKQLKVGFEPVLDALPRLNVFQGVEHSEVALNMPYRDRSLSAGYSSGRDLSWMRRKSVWGTLAVLLLIAGMFAVSPDVLKRFAAKPAPVVEALSDGTTVEGVPVAVTPSLDAAKPAAAAAPVAASGGPATVADQVLAGQAPAAAASEPAAAPPADPAAAAAPAASAGQGVRLAASQEVWVQVMSGKKRLFERTLQPGESVDVPGEAPLRIVAGRAAAVTVSYNGQPLTSTAKGTVGRYRVEP
ncbi:helix-turn-helix domain-containing protein [Amphibiibacter pelophylacis]|uniref:DUF4115 domain-containing protein n=1 Tax=Amphibiibacter pelophylacis TaxID=1799477 RepID=A0ACC6NZ11_9BURK